MKLERLKQLICGLMVGALASCGGGGGNPGTSTGGIVTPPPVVTTPSLTLTIQNSSKAIVNSITVGNAYSAVATVLDSTGAPVAGKLVTFTVSSAIAVLNPTTALTNSLGVASVPLSPATISSAGAGSLSASATVGTDTATGSIDFAVSASSLSLSTVTAGALTLQSGGNTPLSVTALIGGSAVTANPVSVTFRVSCGRIDDKDATQGGIGKTTNGSGVASATYSAVTPDGSPCSGLVTINADSLGANAPALTITVAPPIANAINFVSAAPQQISVKDSGAIEQSLVTFRVLTATGSNSSNTAVNFSLQSNPGGVSLSATSGTTDVNGLVTVSVFSGTIPGPVKVRANLASDPAIFSETLTVTVASGPPSQKFMSLSVTTYNIEAFEFDGTKTTINVRIADRQGNAVPDGTVVNFTTNSGQVARSCATTGAPAGSQGGISSCSVIWQSQSARVARPVVLAYVAGTKDYVDFNGNNRFDLGVDTLVDQGDAFRDDNENGVYDAALGEFLLPGGGTNVCTGSGAGSAFPSRANTCDGTLVTTVREQVVLMASSSVPAPIVRVGGGFTSFNFQLRSRTNTLLPMPAGTTVAAQVIDNTSGNSLSCSVGTIFGGVVPSIVTAGILDDLSTSVNIGLKDCAAGDAIEIKVTSPNLIVTSQIFTL